LGEHGKRRVLHDPSKVVGKGVRGWVRGRVEWEVGGFGTRKKDFGVFGVLGLKTTMICLAMRVLT
jgi:hypothetical protein